MKPDTIATALDALRDTRRSFEGYRKHLKGADDIIARLDSAIADLTTQAEPQGAQWTPVPLGEHKLHDRNGALYGYLIVTPMRLELMTVADDQHVIMHGPNYRLCHLTPASPAPEGVTQPDWSQAEGWATHHVYNAIGEGFFMQDASLFEGRYYAWSYRRSSPSGLLLPIGIDWRTTLTQRPPAGQG